MRALILVLALVVIGLAASILYEVDRGRDHGLRVGAVFHIGGLIADAQGGESAWYRETSSGRVAEYRVVQAPTLPSFAVPFKQIQRRLMDEKGKPYEGPLGTVTYDHQLTKHGFLPLTAPDVPDALDRVWVIRAIRPDRLALGSAGQSTTWPCWRIDLIDPALPDGQDTVVAWVTKDVPVYGLLKWKRGGETWELLRGEMASGAGK